MSWLSKLPGNISKWIGIGIQVANPVGQIIGAGNPGAGDTFNQVVETVGNVEVIVGNIFANQKSGKQKLQAAIPIVASIVANSPVFAPQRRVNQQLFDRGVEGLTNAIVDLMNAHSGQVDRPEMVDAIRNSPIGASQAKQSKIALPQ